MIINHLEPHYASKRRCHKDQKYNGAYYYSKDICKYIIPNVKTDRTWVTVRVPEANVNLNHSIVFIHNNRNPNYYTYLRDYKDVICVCSTKHTYENMKFFGNPVYLPLSVNVESIKKFRLKKQDREMAFAGRCIKITNKVPSRADILTDMPQSDLLREMAHYQKIFAVGRTAIQAKILGAEVLPYDNLYPDPKVWQILDCKDAAKMLQKMLDEIDGVSNEEDSRIH